MGSKAFFIGYVIPIGFSAKRDLVRVGNIRYNKKILTKKVRDDIPGQGYNRN